MFTMFIHYVALTRKISIPFHGWITIHCVYMYMYIHICIYIYMLYFVYPFICWGTLSGFHIFATLIMLLNSEVQVSVWLHVFISFSIYIGVELEEGHMAILYLTIWKTAIVHSNWSTFYSHHQFARVLISPCPHQHLLFI